MTQPAEPGNMPEAMAGVRNLRLLKLTIVNCARVVTKTDRSPPVGDAVYEMQWPGLLFCQTRCRHQQQVAGSRRNGFCPRALSIVAGTEVSIAA